jgi:hypothetical protein
LAEEGIEPSRPNGQGILNPQRLPFRHSAGLIAQGNYFPAFSSAGIMIEKPLFCKVFNPRKPIFDPAGVYSPKKKESSKKSPVYF